MNLLDQTIVNVALPTIQRNLHFSQVGLAWIVDAYLLTFGGFLLLAGRFGDLIGRKKVFLFGVALFTISSLLCGLATTQAMLVGARFAQGAGAAFSTSVVLAIIVSEFHDPIERAKATNIFILVSVGGGSLGLILGGMLTQLLSWHWIFIVNVPIGIATIVAGIFLLDESEGLGMKAGLDIGGALLSTGGVMLAIYAIVTSTAYGLVSAHTLGFAGAAVIVLAAFFVLETRLTIPLMPLRVLRSRGLGSSSLGRAFMAFGMYGTLFLGALFLQHVLGLTALQTGFAFLPQTLMVAVMTLGITARINKILNPRLVAILGFSILFIALMLFVLATPSTSYFPQIFFALFLVGIGAAMVFTNLLTAGMANLPPADAGLGSGLINVSQQMAAAVAVAVLSVVANNRTKDVLATGSSIQHAVASGYQLSFIVAALCMIAGIFVVIFLVPKQGVGADADLAPVVESIEL